jgi:hypothetical protein
VIVGDDSQKICVGHNLGSITSADDHEREKAVIERKIGECRELSPYQANFEEIKSWIRICECEHRSQGSQGSQGSHGGHDLLTTDTEIAKDTVGPLRLIDVEDQCVIGAGKELRYFALSYPWGQAEQVKLKVGTLSQFKTKAGLERIKLPKTIRDAMVLTSRLGERYLWADVLCIIQDEATNKEAQLARMGAIYSNAVLTIVAGKGKDADAGLCRVNNNAGNNPFASDNAVLSKQHPDNFKGSDWQSLLDSVWASRA